MNFKDYLDQNKISYELTAENLTVGGDLNLYGTNITALPENLTVGGNLNLYGTNITTLPENLTVGGNLNLQDTNITTLPENLTIGGDLDLYGTNITALPENLTIGGDLDLYGTNITALPENLSVGGWLNLRDTNITILPENLTVGGNLNLRDTNITILPENLTVGGDLNLYGTNITTLPENLTVGGWLNLRGTNITTLPENLTVGGSLNLYGTNITTLPENLTVGGWLNLRGTNIKIKEKAKVKTLPKKFYIRYRSYIESKLTWQNGKYRKIDGIFCEVIKQKNNILTVKISGKKAYIFCKDGIYAHGNTVKQAYYDYLFKTSDRDVSKYKDIELDEIHDLEFWVLAYRTITGACSFGTNNYLENNKDKYKEQMSLEEVLKATENQYGGNTFKEFFMKG